MSQQSINDGVMAREGALSASSESRENKKPSKRKTRKAFVACGALLLIGAAGFAAQQFPQLQHFLAQQLNVKRKTPDPSLPDSPFLTHAKQAGISACSNVFPVLGEILTNGASYNVVSEWNEQEPDEHPIQALAGLNYSGQSYNGAAGGVVIAAPRGDNCEGAMVRIAPLPMSCENVPATLPQGSALNNTLGSVSLYGLANNGGQALLIPSSDICVVVSIAWVKD